MAEAAALNALRRSRNFLMETALRKAPKKPVVPIKRWRVTRGDTVEIIADPKVSADAGKQGKVLRVDRKKNRVYVEGVAMRKKAIRPEPGKEGGMVPVEGAIHYSNVALVDPTTGQGSKVRYRKTEDGTAVRVSVRSGAIIPRSDESRIRKKPRPSEAAPGDTPSEVVTKETWAGLDAEVERTVRRRRLRRKLQLAQRQRAQGFNGFVPPPALNRAPFAKSEPDERA